MAQRSTFVKLFNNTSGELRRTGAHLSHGVWSESDVPLTPPEIIRTIGEWQSESQGFATGTEGTVVYEMPIDGDKNGTLEITIHWDNPFIGSNSYSSKLSDSKRFKITHTGGSGNNATVTFELSRL